MAVWTDSEQTQAACPEIERPLIEGQPPAPAQTPTGADSIAAPREPSALLPTRDSTLTARQLFGWPVPSSLSTNPDEARARIQLPEFDDFLLERARVIAGRFALAEAEYRNPRLAETSSHSGESRRGPLE